MPTVTIIENGSQTGSIDTEQETGDYQGENRIAELVVESVEDGVSNTTNDEDQDTDDGELLPPSKSVDVSGDKLVEFVTGNLDVAGVEFEVESSELGDTNFSHCGCGEHLTLSDVDTEGWDDWEHDLFELQQNVAHADGDKHLNEIVESAMPEFVKDRIRDAIMSDTLFSDFATIADQDLQQLRLFMEEQLEQDGWTTDMITGRLQDLEPELTKDEAETIARTESQALINDARETGYEETGMVENEQFYWVGGLDDRTTDACKWLIGGTDEADNIGGNFDGTNPNYGGTPRSLGELKELVQEAAKKDPAIDTKAREWTPHINCRKSYVRSV